jgi:5-formyltetrahydrofolate cyclo-ligase
LAQSRKDIRLRMRARRSELSAREQRRAAARITRLLESWLPWRRACRVALFLPNDGEPDLGALISSAWRSGKRVYLPVLAPVGGNRLWFRRYRADSRMLPNRFGIPEPSAPDPLIHPRHLDLVLAPLVAFDAEGRRLGMGGGFYDRTFDFLVRHKGWRHPRMVGVAHHFQQVDTLPVESWDVPLAALVTDHGLLQPNRQIPHQP